MTVLFRILLRSTAILCGYVAACIAASLLIAFIFFAPDPGGMRLADPAMLARLAFLVVLIANAGFAPAAIAIAYAEITARRSWLYYALAGGAAALFAVTIAEFPALGSAKLAAVLIATGMIAGWVYWLLAGRFAGRLQAASPAFRQQDLDREG